MPIVFLLCVMMMNCVSFDISRTSSVKRPMLASSSGASTSSRMQNGLGVYWKMPTSSENAVSAFSPPESSSTFCSLDEVDAPLDEANVGRYNDIVKEMSAISQFILITHNKRTMEMVDTLYGVTMEEPGVSKLVSVRLSERTQSAAA